MHFKEIKPNALPVMKGCLQNVYLPLYWVPLTSIRVSSSARAYHLCHKFELLLENLKALVCY